MQSGGDFVNVSLGDFASAYQGNRWSGAIDPDRGPMSWTFERQ